MGTTMKASFSIAALLLLTGASASFECVCSCREDGSDENTTVSKPFATDSRCSTCPNSANGAPWPWAQGVVKAACGDHFPECKGDDTIVRSECKPGDTTVAQIVSE